MRREIVALCAVALAMAIGIAVMPAPSAEAQDRPPGIQYTCGADDIGATLTRFCVADVTSLRRYVTDIVAQSTTATGGQFILRYGTGTNCGTGTTSLLPSAATAARLTSPPNTAAPTVIVFKTPLVIPADKDLCVLGVATNTTTIQVSGYLAP